MLGDTWDLPSTASSLQEKEDPDSNLHSMNIIKVVLRLRKLMVLEAIPTTDDLHKSFQQHGQSGRPLLWNQQHISAVSDAQLDQAMLVVLKDYWRLNCRICRD